MRASLLNLTFVFCVIGLCLFVYVAGYKHGRFGDQTHRLMQTDETIVVIIASQADLPHEAEWSRSSLGISAIYRDKAAARRALGHVEEALWLKVFSKDEQNGGQP